MRLRFIIAAVSIMFLASCEKEEIVPRTNPRFSVTLVQSISEEGAEFRARMIDRGSDEILEYGFVYSESDNPTIGYSDYVSNPGAPQENFTLSASYGLIEGTIYYVAAFLRTSNGIVYSTPTEFLSQGSKGFVFDRMEFAQPAYYGDTILVFAERLSTNLQNYEIKVNGTPAQVLGLTKESFEIIIPSLIQIDRIDDQSINLNFDITIAGKKLELNEQVNFKEPQFFTNPIQEVFYQQEVVIKGDFLTSDEVQVIMKSENGGGWPLPVMKYEEKEITFLARMNNYIAANGSLVVEVRGKEYPLKDVFRMKGSELIPNQQFSGKTYDYYEVLGQNFIEEYQGNEFLSDIPGVAVPSEHATSDMVGVIFGRNISSRNLKVYANNYGQKSKNYAEFHFTDPNLRFMPMPEEFVGYRNVQESGVTVEGIGYFFLENNVYRINPELRKVEKVASGPESVYHLAGGFSYASINGKIYLGAIGKSVSQNSFWEFDPKTNKLKQLADIPSLANKPKLIYSMGSHLYFEGGYKYTAGGYIWDAGVYKYTISTNTWEKLEREFENDQYTVLFRTFRYDGAIYTIMDNTGSIYPEIRQFNPTTENWEPYADLGHFGRPTSANEIFVIGDWVYSFYPEEVSAFNMRTESTKIWQHGFTVSYFNWNYSFQSEDKIYVYSDRSLFEFDPEYFDQ
ncbi:kelch repeat-containing protein [Algoriphagus sp. AGSA1]|uniref:kelch repeat-containing protein n=1 Tax=Algoriphagus sp. AGSA1 TaxID=2907213 RepID=UPI001F3C9E7C|nr:kelch repeat-containing protein [Algoriphagus sp. AGSA1]MCE7055815.1 kelch repeat-containing protein [Algoriphagus sp. AGSA1]